VTIIHGPTVVTYRDSSLRHFIVDDFGRLVPFEGDLFDKATEFLKSVFIYNKGDIGC